MEGCCSCFNCKAFRIIVDSHSCNMICTRLALEYLPGLVDFTIKLNLNDKQRGALSKLQHFVGNRMSRDIMMSILGDPVEWMLGFSIGSKYLRFLIRCFTR